MTSIEHLMTRVVFSVNQSQTAGDAEAAMKQHAVRHLAVLDDEPVISTTMIAMLREEAARVLCPVGIALAAALPPGSTPRAVASLVLTPRGAAALEARLLPPDSLALLAELGRAPRTPALLRRRLPGADALLGPLEADGLVARRPTFAGALDRCSKQLPQDHPHPRRRESP